MSKLGGEYTEGMLALLSLLLTASPSGPSQLILEVKPSKVLIFVDGRKVGDASKVRTVTVKPGTHDIKLTHGGDSHSDQVVVKPAEKLRWKFEFEDDRRPRTTPTEDPAPAESTSDDARPEAATPAPDPGREGTPTAPSERP